MLVDDSKYSPLGYETKLFYTMNNYIVETPRERRGVSILFCDHFEGNKVVSAGGAFWSTILNTSSFAGQLRFRFTEGWSTTLDTY